MIAWLICWLLGHSFDELESLEITQPPVCVSRKRCARCGEYVVTVRDLRDDVIDEHSDRLQ